MLTPVPEDRLYKLDAMFGEHVAALHPKLDELLAAKPISYTKRPASLPQSVVYLISENETPFYVGRSRKFSQRLRNHCGAGSQPNQSSLAYKLACKQVKFEPIPYSQETSWKRAMNEVDGLREAFQETKTRLSDLPIRYVVEEDDVRQALLEIYCAVALKTPHNSWKTS